MRKRNSRTGPGPRADISAAARFSSRACSFGSRAGSCLPLGQPSFPGHRALLLAH